MAQKHLVVFIFLALTITSSFGAFGSLDIAVDQADWPEVIFTVSHNSPDRVRFFIIGVQSPQVGITLYDMALDQINQMILPNYYTNQTPVFSSLHPNVSVDYWGNDAGEDMWLARCNTYLPQGPLVQAVFIPEPATLLLLGVGGLLARRQALPNLTSNGRSTR